MTEHLRITRLTSIKEALSLEAEWRGLEPTLPPLPFTTFDWFKTWWEVLHAESLSVSDDPFVLVIRDGTGALRGIAPFMLTRRPGRGPLSLRQLQLFGADPNITEIRTLIAPEGDVRTLLPAVLAELNDCRDEWDFVQLTGIPAHCSDLLGTGDVSGRRWVRDVPNYSLRLQPTWDAFKTRLPRNIKESLRKCYNAPKRDGVSFDFEIVADPDQVDAALVDFFRLHEGRAGQLDTVPHPNVFATPSSRRFLSAVCRRFAERGRLRVFRLKRGSDVVATRIGFLCGQTLYLYFSGYDSEYARYSVMTRTVAEAIKWAIEAGLSTVNLSTGRDESKLRWGPDEAVYREACLISQSLRGVFAEKSYTWIRAQRGRQRANPGLTSLFARRG